MHAYYIITLEKQSNSHFRSFETNGFKEFISQYNFPGIASMCMKFTQKMHQSIPFRPLPVLVTASFPPNKIESLSSWRSNIVSQVITNGRRVAGDGVGKR